MRRSPTGAIVPISGTDRRNGQAYSHFAFIPHPLETAPVLATATWDQIVRASSALARLDQVARISGARELAGWMSAPLLRLEAQSTTAIEGTFEPARAVLEADEDDAASQSAEMREILNYVRAARQCFAYATQDRELTVGMACELQSTLVAGTSAADRDPGRIRGGQVAIGSPNGTVDRARFVPMPPGIALESSLSALLDWQRARDTRGGTDLVELAMFHYQFEAIHPFADGNGRIGRMLIIHSMLRRGLLAEPLLTISPWLERNDRQYRDALYGVSATGDWDTWIRFFALAVERSSRDVESKIQTVFAVATAMEESVSGSRAGSVQRRLPALLVRRPVVTVRDVANELECTAPPAQTAVNSLVHLGYLREVTGGTYGRRYSADAILDALVSQDALT